MLPDYIELKRTLQQRLTGRSHEALRTGSIVGLGTSVTIHEGNEWEIHRPDGTSERSAYEAVEGEFSISFEELEQRGAEAVLSALRRMTSQMQEAIEREVFDELKRITEEAGTTTDAAGRPFTAELFLESLEKLQFSFAADGEWKPPQLVISPKNLERVASELDRLDSDEELRGRLEDLLTTKREEWLEQENRRKLVD